MYKTHIGGGFNSILHVTLQKKFFIAFVTIIVMQALYSFLIFNDIDAIFSNSASDTHSSQQETIQSSKYDPLFYIPHSTVSLWNERDFLVVFGIPSLDIPKRRWRRHMQRSTCWKLPGVATRDNNFTGAMLVLYLLARNPINNFVLSDGLLREAEQWHDVLVSPINEGLSDTNKMKDGKGSWGFEAEIGASRKTFIWFQMALLIFPRVPYFAKGDDDIFLRAPQYLADLRRLPINKTYWGRQGWWKAWLNKNGDRKAPFRFMFGFCYAMSRDIAAHVTSYKLLRQQVWVPFNKERLHEFRLLSMENEDVMVGRSLDMTGYPTIRVREPIDRFHHSLNLPVTDTVVVTHAPKEHEYYIFMSHFKINGTTTPDTGIFKKSSLVFEMQSPKQKRIIVKKN